MKVRNGQLVIHVTEVGGCVRSGMLAARGEPVSDRYFHSDLGTAVHRVSEAALRQLRRDGRTDVSRAMRAVYERFYQDKDDFWDWNRADIEEKVDRLETWLSLERQRGTFDVPFEVEVELELPLRQHRIHGMPVVLRGRADLVTSREVVELKTGRTRARKHTWQASVYSTLHSRTSRRAGPQPARVVYLGAPLQVRRFKNGRIHRYYERSLSPAAVTDCFKGDWDTALNAYVTEVRQHWPQLPEPEDQASCYFCSYRQRCSELSYDQLDLGPGAVGSYSNVRADQPWQSRGLLARADQPRRTVERSSYWNYRPRVRDVARHLGWGDSDLVHELEGVFRRPCSPDRPLSDADIRRISRAVEEPLWGLE